MGTGGTMNLWQTFLVMEVSCQYGLSFTEQAILSAKFPDENSIRTNEQIADSSIEDDKLPWSTETVDRHMRTIYKKLGCPKENYQGFSGYNQKRGQARDPELLDWLKQIYWDSDYFKKQSVDTSFASPIDVADLSSTMPSNPFIPTTGIVDDPLLFFGREREIRSVFETLNSGSSVALIGERAIGKSSMLKAIERLAEKFLKPPRKPIYLNLQLIDNDDDFYGAFCDLVNIPICKGYSLFRALKEHRLLLIIDEVEKMTWEGFTNQVRTHLRGLAEGNDAPVRVVVAACTSLDRLFPDSHDEGMTSPFTGICLEENIRPWDEITIRNFITTRLAKTDVSFTEEEILQLIAESNGYPQRLMQLCYRTYARYLEGV